MEAIRVLDELITRWPDSPEAPAAKAELGGLHFARGLNSMQSGDVGAAESAFNTSKGWDENSGANLGLAVIQTTATPFTDPFGTLELYEGAPTELQTYMSAWACEGLIPERVTSFGECFTLSTSPSVDRSATAPKGQVFPDLSEIGDRFDAMERSCIRAESFIGTVCGEARLAAFRAQTAPRRQQFIQGIRDSSGKWRSDFAKEWKDVTGRLLKIAVACESDKKSMVRRIRRQFGAGEFKAKLVWHESAKNKSRAAYEVSDSIRESYLQYVAYTLAVWKSAVVGTTPECRASDGSVDFLKRLWDECSGMEFNPSQDWISEAVIDGCPFKGDNLR